MRTFVDGRTCVTTSGFAGTHSVALDAKPSSFLLLAAKEACQKRTSANKIASANATEATIGGRIAVTFAAHKSMPKQ